MRLHSYFFTLCFVVSLGTAANISLIEIVTQLPSCALGCITTRLASSQTSLSNLSSICFNVTLQTSISACVQGKCNYTEQAQVATVNSQLCSGVPVESRAWPVAIVGLVCVPLALIAVALRCYSRYSIARKLSADDWMVISAASLLVALVALDIINVLKNGFGRHIWDIDPLHVPSGLKTFYAAEILYICVITMVKVSILLFYMRVFPGKWFKIANLIVLATVISSGASIILAIILQCSPISGAWDRTINPKCININMLAFAAAGISVAQDIIILILPIPDCAKLHMNKRKKLNVMFMFSLGGVACVTSIIRLHYLADFSKSSDQTWDNAFPAIWSFLEICVATICACLPNIRVLLSRWVPFIFDITNSSSSYHHEKLNSNDLSTHNTSTNAAAKKIRSSYNKRTLFMTDEELLSTTPVSGVFGDTGSIRRGNREHTTKVWINPQFNAEENVIESQGPIADTRNSQPSSETSLWALEGPMINDGGGSVEDKTNDFETGNIGVVVSRGSLSVEEEYGNPRLQRIYSLKSLPMQPTSGRPGNIG